MDEQEKELEEILSMFGRNSYQSSERNHIQIHQNKTQLQHIPQKSKNFVHTVNPSKRNSNRSKSQSNHGNHLSPICKTARKRKQRQRILIVSVFSILFLVIVFILIFKGCYGGKERLSVIQGTWYYNQDTEYEFDGEGNGCMYIDRSNHYEFRYDIDGDKLKVDYALDYVTDCEYTFRITSDKLTLVGGSGTAEPGKVYELTKQP